MLQIKNIPAFNDNYIWLIQNSDRRCAVIDPGDATPVLAYLEQHDLTLEAILITHHHNDHIGGVPDLVHHFPNLDVVGPTAEPIPTLTHPVEDGDQLQLFGERFHVMSLAGHTLGHIGYVGCNNLFCGDVLFSAGCGRIFEGTAEQMFESINKISQLDPATNIYCAHEYTSSNLAFALAVEPDNVRLQQYRSDVNRLRVTNTPTIPTTLAHEMNINPFLRVTEPSIIKSVLNRSNNSDPLSVFTALRQWKDEF